MNDLDFYQTLAGREFYDKTMTELVRQIARLNEFLERAVERLGPGTEHENGGSE